MHPSVSNHIKYPPTGSLSFLRLPISFFKGFLTQSKEILTIFAARELAWRLPRNGLFLCRVEDSSACLMEMLNCSRHSLSEDYVS